MRTISSACHTAHIDDLTGVGMLVCPSPQANIPMVGETSLGLHEADWNVIADRLHREGRELLEDNGMVVEEEGVHMAGGYVLALYGLNPIIDNPTLEQIADAHRELRQMVGS